MRIRIELRSGGRDQLDLDVSVALDPSREAVVGEVVL
jgi:hypothetical protein